MGRSGGPNLYCPNCKKITTCNVTPSKSQNMQRTDYDDIHYFSRSRMCSKCSHFFQTAELDEQFLSELVELRDALSNIKANAESYIDESVQAQESLGKLTESLNMLKELDVYKETKSI
jgi:hypothetical protein